MYRRALVVVSLVLAACRGTEPFVPLPTSITVTPGTASLTSIGATRQLTAVVLDQRGDAIPNPAVQWATVDARVATVDGRGVLTARGVGSTQVQATIVDTSGALSASADVAVTQVPRRLVKVSGDRQADTVAGTLQAPVVVRVEDSLGAAIPRIVVGFRVTQGGGTPGATADTSDAGGLASIVWTLGGAPGANALAVSIAGSGVTGSPAAFTASAVAPGTVPTVVRFAGNAQTGLVGFAVNVPPAVLVRSPSGTPIAGKTVVFAISGGGGSITGATALSDASGIVRVGSWSLTSGANALTATVQDTGLIVGNPVSFTATGAARSYHVDVRFLSSMTPEQEAAFTNAANRWETLIFGDVSDVPVSIPAGRCGSRSPALSEIVDDVVIFASIDSIDGSGAILGQAGPCAFRSSSGFPLLGVMEFDSADVADLQNAGQLDLVIEHEMGHVLGFGTIWSSVLSGGGGSDPHFVGPQALAAFDRVGGTSYAGTKVPVENCCSSGTRDSHWRESVLKNELMTGFLQFGANPLSVVTTASMGDLGYLVNYAASDPYVVTVSLAARAAPVRSLGDDLLRLPLMEVDAAGRIVRVIPPR
jgi:hypothetical protein